jgi:hypothetical protein
MGVVFSLLSLCIGIDLDLCDDLFQGHGIGQLRPESASALMTGSAMLVDGGWAAD